MSDTNTITITIRETTLRCTPAQAEVLSVLEQSRSGFVTLHNYVSATGYEKDCPKIATVTVNGLVSTEKVYDNSDKELEELTVEDVRHLLTDWKPYQGRKNENNRATLEEQFARCKEMLLARNEGNGSATHKKAHEDHSITIGCGIKVWLNDDENDGVRSIKSVNMQCLVVSEKVHQHGERKASTPGSKVQVDNAIAQVLNKRKTAIKTYNPLKADRVSISGMVITN